MNFPKDSASLRAKRGNPGQHMLKVKGPKDYLTGSPRRVGVLDPQHQYLARWLAMTPNVKVKILN